MERKLTKGQSLAHLSLLTLEGVGGRPQIGFSLGGGESWLVGLQWFLG